MPRRLRPISRWISTVRPSGRPLETSRCLRSPVEAGSIPYSEVSHPRPWPTIQRGTDSCTDAVQMTRVSPQEISAEPVAVRTNPGSIVIGRSSPGPRPYARSGVIASPAPGSRTRSAPSRRDSSRHQRRGLEGDPLDLAERELEEAAAEGGEALHVTRGEERVLPLTVLGRRQPAGAEHMLDLAGERRAGRDDADVAA